MNYRVLFGVVFAGLLISTQLKAQLDSNAHVSFYSGDFSAGCTMTIYYTEVPDYKDTFTTTESAYLDSHVRYNGKFSSTMTLAPYPPIQFFTLSIDSVHQILSIQYDTSAVRESDLESGEDDLSVSVDSIPYSITPNGGLFCKGIYLASYAFGSFRVLKLHRDGSGSCSSQGKSTDSIYLQIDPQNSSVSQIPASPNIFFLSVNNVTTPLAFKNLREHQDLDLFDVAGRHIAHFSDLEPGSQIQIGPVPNGIYFAHTGSQVVKFGVIQ